MLLKSVSNKFLLALISISMIATLSLFGCSSGEQSSEEVEETTTEVVEETPETTEEVTDTSNTKSDTTTNNDNSSSDSSSFAQTQTAPKSTSSTKSSGSSAPAASTPAPAQKPAHEHSWTPVTSNKTVYVCCDGATFNSDAAASSHEMQLARADEQNHSYAHMSQQTTTVTTGYKCSCGATK